MRILLKTLALAGFATVGVAISLPQGPPPSRATAQDAPPAHVDVRYDRDIRPILSDRCFLCHGPDPSTRQAGLRLDSHADAVATRDGGAAIVPGDVDQSLLWQRINATDPDEVMPPPSSGKHTLAPAERELLRQWIATGAPYEPHWSFLVPKRTALPGVSHPDWARNEIDRFILARLDRAGLAPSPEADRATLLRRVFLDLTGLPPTPGELDAFLADERPDAYERWVDWLLSEEPYVTRYAERMASPWLDQARYADTNGIHTDAGRSIWPWRDWVLNAYRQNMPYDQFVVEQVAGDLLPDPTLAQRVATGFHRNHVVSDENGAIPEELLVEYAVDRVATTGSVFLGLTLGCARCHDHKFDPVTQEDFYSFAAFFNSINEPGLYVQQPDPKRAFDPAIPVPTPEQADLQARATERLALLRQQASAITPEENQRREQHTRHLLASSGVRWEPLGIVSATSTGGATLAAQSDGSILASGANPAADEHRLTLRTDATGLRLLLLEVLTDPSHPGGRIGRSPNGNGVLTGLTCEAVSTRDPAQRKPVRFNWAWADVEQTNGDHRIVNLLDDGPDEGWAPSGHDIDGGRVAVLLAEEPFGYEGGTELHVTLAYNSKYPQHTFGRVRLQASTITPEALATLPEAHGAWFLAGGFTAEPGKLYEQALGPEDGLDLARRFGPEKRPWSFDPAMREGQVRSFNTSPGVVYFGRRVYSPVERETEVLFGSDDGVRVFVNGTDVFSHRVDREPRPDQDRTTPRLRAGRNDIVFKVVNTGGLGGFACRMPENPQWLGHDLFATLLPAAALPLRLQGQMVQAWRAAHEPGYQALLRQMEQTQTELADVTARIPLTMVMSELPKPRETFVLARGQYDLPDKSRPVQRGIPRALGTMAEDAPANRLGLARWIVSRDNPLTARVTVNRLWEQFFGIGLVASSDDLGMQGEWPSHPELLDWLAVEFQEGGWDLRATIRRIVTSSTYRQSARVREESAAVDPENRLLAWFPRQRLSAEQIRDSALYVSGLLVEELGGPSVKPYQPPGLWEEVSMPQSNTRTYKMDEGRQLWRRSLYTYWKRAVPPPSMLTFDAPTREFCVTRRLPTNTPLQALALWNDTQFVEAARALAGRVLQEASLGDDRARLASLVRRCTARTATPQQLDAMAGALAEFRGRFRDAPEDATRLVSIGQAPAPAGVDPSELAAWTLIANAVLSADAAISKN